MRRKLAVAGVAVGLVAAAVVAYGATGSGTGTSQINCQTSAFEKIPVSGTKPYRQLGGATTNVTSIYPATITLSGVLRGKPAKIRIVDKWISGNDVALPGPITVKPVNGAATPFSFTWIAPGSSAAEKGHKFVVSWKRASASGISTMLKADVVVTYTSGSCTGGFTTP